MKIGVDYIGISTPFFCNDGKGNFLLHKRGKGARDEHGSWDSGSGGLEFGLTPEENVLKEVREEYGCEGIIQEQLPPYDLFREKDGVKSHWLAIPFFVLIKRGEEKIGEPESIESIGWFTLDNIPTPRHPGLTYALEHLKKYFDTYRS